MNRSGPVAATPEGYAPMQQTYVVYWREADRQLFGFRQNITAPSPRAAREMLRSMKRLARFILGVKGLASCGRRCSHRGQWLG